MPLLAPRTIRLLRPAAVAVLLAAALACQPPRAESSGPGFRASVGGADWELVEVGGQTAPTGAGGRRATLVFDADSARMGGFAGCNRYGGTYTLAGDSLRFGPVMMTKMACTEGMPLETRLASVLEATRRVEHSSTQLTLFGEAGPLARFTRKAP